MDHSPRLQTARLTLRPIAAEDFEAFYQVLVLDPAVMAFYHGYKAPLTDAERRAKARRDFFDHFAEGAARFGYISWALCAGPAVAAASTSPGALLGWAGIVTPALRNPRLGPELAYMLAREWHGQGIVTEAARAVVLDAFPRYRLHTVHAVMDAPNRASRRVAEKLGFAYQGAVHVYGSDDMVLYVLDRAAAARLDQ